MLFAQHVRGVGNGEFGSDCFSDTDGVCDQKQMGDRSTGAREGSGQPARGAARRARRAGASEAIFDGDRRRNANGGGGRNQPFILLSARQLCIMQQSNQANSVTARLDLSHTLWYPFWCPHFVGRFSTLAFAPKIGVAAAFELRDTTGGEAGSLPTSNLRSLRDYCLQVGSKDHDVAGIARELGAIAW